MNAETWLAFAAASAVLLAMPGPTVLLVLAYALRHGRRVAVAMAAGVALGDLVAMTAALAGLGALILASSTAFTLVKLAGAGWLVWLGVKLIRGAAVVGLPDAPEAASPGRMFRHAAAVTALNPKSIGFFLAFVPQFLSPDAPMVPQAALLIATFVGLGILNALAYALPAARLRPRLLRPAVQRALARMGGTGLVAMGLATALTRRAPA